MYVVSKTEIEYFLNSSKLFTDLIVGVQSIGRVPSVSTESLSCTILLVINSDFIIINSDFITLKLFYRYIALMVNLQAC